MNLIPFRTKRTSGIEASNMATLADFRNEMNRLFEGFFSRPIPLPEAVDLSQVTARYDKDVLTVELTKSPTAASRKVPMQIGG